MTGEEAEALARDIHAVHMDKSMKRIDAISLPTPLKAYLLGCCKTWYEQQWEVYSESWISALID